MKTYTCDWIVFLMDGGELRTDSVWEDDQHPQALARRDELRGLGYQAWIKSRTREV